MTNWKEIWSRERRIPQEKPDIDFLIEMDGFNSGAGKIASQAWLEYVEGVAELTGLNQTKSIFEVGCGSGAFVFPFYLKGHRVGGIDYSSSLIDLAMYTMPDMDFSVQQAADLNILEKYDLVVANSVFQYFNSYDYAEEVILRMCEKADSTVAILDLNDKRFEEEALIIRKGSLSEGEYEKKYAGLSHLFYDREFVNRVLANRKYTVKTYDQNIENYGNNKFRYNVVIEKW